MVGYPWRGDPSPAVADPLRIEAAARRAAAHDMILQLPNGYDALLGKTFLDGTDLSGGQWQRVAAARAFPTAGMFTEAVNHSRARPELR